ncbi:hypothetical protein EPI10_023734 [Gossypium australe]|uniref:Reverse transcriptase Ty1/copia-type domain-containing protein n=1 Tax=Gossypium australe TaxID=47621 RepID=A0A5B6VVM7_9ROSI|nr:hypothetical protein EPI10_023734 [Gossypium australe]
MSVPLPPDRKAIGCKRLFKIKRIPNGTMALRKGWLVAKGCSWVPGCDFHETFSPVVKPTTITTILSIVVPKRWSILHVDANNAFLNGEITEEYILDLLDHCHMMNAKAVHTPMLSSSYLSKTLGNPVDDPSEYRSLAGALQYAVLIRLDIAYAVNRICQFMHNPTNIQLMALKLILRYLSGTVDYGLLLKPLDRLSLVGYAYANWGLDIRPPSIVSILVTIPYCGVLRSNRLCLSPLLKLNIMDLLLPLQMLYG